MLTSLSAHVSPSMYLCTSTHLRIHLRLPTHPVPWVNIASHPTEPLLCWCQDRHAEATQRWRRGVHGRNPRDVVATGEGRGYLPGVVLQAGARRQEEAGREVALCPGADGIGRGVQEARDLGAGQGEADFLRLRRLSVASLQ